MQQIWTAIHHNGPNRIGLWLNQVSFQHVGSGVELSLPVPVTAPQCLR